MIREGLTWADAIVFGSFMIGLLVLWECAWRYADKQSRRRKD